ncbi:MAG: TatD family hydrolase [Armatimonadetes bacterium]|nr:TatD family hydrolase [Armatimonadota bacterium]
MTSIMVDTHVHLDSPGYRDDWRQVLDRAELAGVAQVVAPATRIESSKRLLEMAGEDRRVLPAVGIHPHDAASFDPERSPGELEALASKAVAIGETGLELHYDFAPLGAQLVNLRVQLSIARNLRLPVILHCREAEELLHRELQAAGELPGGGVVHCFTGSWDWARTFLDLGFHLGVTGMVTFKKTAQVHELARRCPLDRLLVETDGPYLAPIPHRGARNESGYIPLVVEQIARLREMTPEEVAAATTAAARGLFGERIAGG